MAMKLSDLQSDPSASTSAGATTYTSGNSPPRLPLPLPVYRSSVFTSGAQTSQTSSLAGSRTISASSAPRPLAFPPSASGVDFLSTSKLAQSDTTNRKYLSELQLSTSSQLLVEKLHRESVVYSHQKDLELKLRHDLEKSKELLSEKATGVESKYYEYINENSRLLESTLAENNRRWEEAMRAKQDEVAELKSTLKDVEKSTSEQLQLKEQEWQSMLHNCEATWMQRMTATEAHYEEQMKSMQDRMELESKARDIAFNARLEAKESNITQQYEKKLLKFEKQVEEVQQTYKNKTLVIQGALDEARRECMNLQAAYIAREDSLREELALKDKRLVYIQKRIDDVTDIERALDRWQKLAVDLATMTIHTCAGAAKLPEYVIPPKDNFREILMGNVSKSEDNRYFEAKVAEYNQLRKATMAIRRKQLIRLLKHSKAVIELSESHTSKIDVDSGESTVTEDDELASLPSSP